MRLSLTTVLTYTLIFTATGVISVMSLTPREEKHYDRLLARYGETGPRHSGSYSGMDRLTARGLDPDPMEMDYDPPSSGSTQRVYGRPPPPPPPPPGVKRRPSQYKPSPLRYSVLPEEEEERTSAARHSSGELPKPKRQKTM
ncbi:hypothetical protein AMATHDRAFT_48387 [Amanita thiersii Skay4041]|uniref:Uncharacterized protein n=1 Tax=Amanita thiersii Skay4041 TaxID=703135 RepID=A0A2A9NQ90_9AGAR|nr:hypothetical protein AMATHDRAFT_48387 [Amanita thiersii Skay4041]